MKISENDMFMQEYGLKENHFVHRENSSKTGEVFENGTEEQKKISLSNQEAFQALCKKFPYISFVVVDEISAVQPEYNGMCNTSAFGDLNQVSIQIEKEVIEKLGEDYDNIVMMIQGIADNYEGVKRHAMASGSTYTAVTLHYKETGDLSFRQTLWFEPPIVCRETGSNKGVTLDTEAKDKYLQAFLMNIRNEMLDKLFEVGKVDRFEKGHKGKSKGAREYQKQFIYEK